MVKKTFARTPVQQTKHWPGNSQGDTKRDLSEGRADSTKMAELVRGNKETTWSVIDRKESTRGPTTTVTAKINPEKQHNSSERESGAGSHMTYSQKMCSQGVYFLLSCTTLSSGLFSCYIRPHLSVFLKQGRHSDGKRKT